jgi:hypothetical protein
VFQYFSSWELKNGTIDLEIKKRYISETKETKGENFEMSKLQHDLWIIKSKGGLDKNFRDIGNSIIRMFSEMFSQLERKLVSAEDVLQRINNRMVTYADVMNVINIYEKSRCNRYLSICYKDREGYCLYIQEQHKNQNHEIR